MNPSPPIKNYKALHERIKNCISKTDPFVSDFPFQINSETYQLSNIVLGKGNPKRALISAGIHGDEPAGVETILQFLETGLYRKYTGQWELNLVPCINPSGWVRETRENAAGEDLNRKFKESNPPVEVRWVQDLLSIPFNLDMELHEDVDSPGYYLYQKESDPLMEVGRKIIQHVSEIMPINGNEEIEEMPSDNGVIWRLSGPDEMEWWPMALYAASRGCPKVYTLETGTGFPMDIRIQSHLKAIEVALTRV